MATVKFSGPIAVRIASFAALSKIAISTLVRHAFGKRMASDWDSSFETGIRFWRHQFTSAMHQSDIARGRLIFDSLQTETDHVYAVTTRDSILPAGTWYIPDERRSGATILYLHGGGYTFHGAVSKRFAAMLAHHIGAPLFAPDYRLTPEHPHPAQAEDALAAWRYVSDQTPAEKLVVIGDSAGGHMVLMLLQNLRLAELPQPALCIGLCPWTDIGERGASLHENNQYDLVQGWMALQFGTWLDPGGHFGRGALSPVSHSYKDLAPVYLQAGGREILRDMICNFADDQAKRGADILLDLWPDMPHDFQAFDSDQASSNEALSRISSAVAKFVDGVGSFSVGPNSLVSAGVFAP